MANAKLWWNGYAWSTSSATCVSKTTYGNHSLGVKQELQVIAYDDFTIKTILKLTGTASGSIYIGYTLSGTVTIKGGSTTVGTPSASGSPWTSSAYAITSYTSASYSATITVRGAGGEPHAAEISISGASGTYSSPFYTVTYDANGGTGAPSATKGVKLYSTTLSDTPPTRVNHTFLGWATSASAHTADYSAGGTVSARTDDLTLYAVWKPTVFIQPSEGTKITFNGTAYTSNAIVTELTWGNSYSLLVEPLAGYIIASQSHPNGTVTISADETTISATGQRVGCHIDDGENWVQAIMYVDTGSTWVMAQAYYDNGTGWELVY